MWLGSIQRLILKDILKLIWEEIKREILLIMIDKYQ